MKYEIVPNGNLVITCEDADKEDLQAILDTTHHTDDGDLAEMLEHAGWSTNGRMFPVRPEWIGALTDAPIVTDDLEYLDDGEAVVRGAVWWFPNYMVESFAKTLISTGTVVFTAAPENANQHVCNA